MPISTLRVLMDSAREKQFAIAAFNVNNMEQIQAIMEAAYEIQAPAIVQASRGARRAERTGGSRRWCGRRPLCR